MWSPSRTIAILNSASAIIASSSSLLVRVVLLLVRVELLPDLEPALLLLLLTYTPSPIEWELWRAPSMLHTAFFFRDLSESRKGERGGEGGEEKVGVEGAGTFRVVLSKVINVSKVV